ncbi:MAG: tetratricopeptide repeat protein, partial [Candidatus Brocadiaceae bacterium]|nr:tetratricopeptide repeat protein [Candidatus Brocadiaceae bacterium]
MKNNLFALFSISILSFVIITLSFGCSDKQRDAEEHYDVGTLHWKEGRIEDAIGEYKRATNISPDFGKAHFNLGCVYTQKGDLSLAIESFKNALKIKPDWLEAHTNLGAAYEASDMFNEAMEQYKMALEQNLCIPES